MSEIDIAMRTGLIEFAARGLHHTVPVVIPGLLVLRIIALAQEASSVSGRGLDRRDRLTGDKRIDE